MAEFNYSKYVADMAQRKGPMHEEVEQNPASNVFANQLQSTDKLVYEEDSLNEYEHSYRVVDGECRKYNDEGEYTVVSMSYCKRDEAIEDTDVEASDDEFDEEKAENKMV